MRATACGVGHFGVAGRAESSHDSVDPHVDVDQGDDAFVDECRWAVPWG